MNPDAVERLLHQPVFQRLSLGLSRIGSSHGLVGIEDPDKIRRQLLRPALAVSSLFREGRPLLDAGSGVGIPGLPIALAGPARPVHLVEPRTRCVSLIRWLLQRLPPITVQLHSRRYEDVPPSSLPEVQVITRSALDWSALIDSPPSWGPIVRWAGPDVPLPPERPGWLARRLRWQGEQAATVIWWGSDELFHVKQFRGILGWFEELDRG